MSIAKKRQKTSDKCIAVLEEIKTKQSNKQRKNKRYESPAYISRKKTTNNKCR